MSLITEAARAKKAEDEAMRKEMMASVTDEQMDRTMALTLKIERHLALIREEIERCHDDVSWGSVGNLGHIETELRDIGRFVTGQDDYC